MTIQLTQDYVNQSLSHATMLDSDLYESFIGFLEDHDLGRASAIKEEYADCIDGEGYLIADHDNVQYLIEALFDALDAIAPNGTYFGAHSGDGSDYGFWQLEEEYSYVPYSFNK